MNTLSIVVLSCDAYSDLWEQYFYFLDYYWNDKSYNTFLVNNLKHFTKDGVEVVNPGNGNWSSRVRFALNKIDSPYVFITLDDYFMSDRVDDEEIDDILSLMQRENIDYYQLEISAKKDYYKWNKFKDYSYLYEIPKTRNYWVDTSVTIWKKDFLLELLGEGDYSAWKFELDRNKDAKYPERYKDKICLLDSRKLISISPMVVQGKFYPDSIKEMKKKGHNIITGNRQVMSIKDVFNHKIKYYFANLPFGKKIFKYIGRKIGFTFLSDIY
jgi:hypothetical protein